VQLLWNESQHQVWLTSEKGDVMCFRVDEPEALKAENKNLGFAVDSNEDSSFFGNNFFFVENYRMTEQQNLVEYMESEIRRLVSLKETRIRNDRKQFKEKLKQIEIEFRDKLTQNLKIKGRSKQRIFLQRQVNRKMS
jgi:ribosomal protein L9